MGVYCFAAMLMVFDKEAFIFSEWTRAIASDAAQDIVEYSLILAFVCLAGAALFLGMGGSTRSLWSTMNSRLANANQAPS
jgi:Flp pilus assembly pilin Flp